MGFEMNLQGVKTEHAGSETEHRGWARDRVCVYMCVCLRVYVCVVCVRWCGLRFSVAHTRYDTLSSPPWCTGLGPGI